MHVEQPRRKPHQRSLEVTRFGVDRGRHGIEVDLERLGRRDIDRRERGPRADAANHRPGQFGHGPAPHHKAGRLHPVSGSEPLPRPGLHPGAEARILEKHRPARLGVNHGALDPDTMTHGPFGQKPCEVGDRHKRGLEGRRRRRLDHRQAFGPLDEHDRREKLAAGVGHRGGRATDLHDGVDQRGRVALHRRLGD